jgi:putative Mg2+ transporter-C (MgtC) family protein
LASSGSGASASRGLRTNTLVSLGAAIFVVFESQFTDTSPTRVAAQVVTGIGFLGAGVIWKEGVNVRGLNTAATLWCSCAVGLLAGAGQWSRAILAAGLVASVNLVLRPLVSLINRQPLETAEIETSYIVTVTCRAHEEAQIRALLVQGFGVSDLHLRELESTDIEGTDRVAVNATLTSEKPGTTGAAFRRVHPSHHCWSLASCALGRSARGLFRPCA